MNSHEYARKLKETADFLLARPEFETEYSDTIYFGNYWQNKDKFLAAVRALGPGTKKYDGSELEFRVASPIPIWLRVNRNVVCRKVQEEKWECESLLSPEEENELEKEN